VLDCELKVWKGIAIERDGLLNALRSLPEIRACWIVVGVVGGKDFIRDSQFSVIPKFQENPQNLSLIF
jgi:hypothetical protein